MNTTVPTPHRRRLPRALKTIVVSVLAVVLTGIVTVNLLARASRWPAAVNMGSHHGTHGEPSTAATSVTDLRLGPTDAPHKSYTLTA
jgi:hypothetical protein